MNGDCKTCSQRLDNKSVGAKVSEAEFVDVLSTIPLSISSTRRSGQNGLRNGEEVYRALQAAGFCIHEVIKETPSVHDQWIAAEREKNEQTN